MGRHEFWQPPDKYRAATTQKVGEKVFLSDLLCWFKNPAVLIYNWIKNRRRKMRYVANGEDLEALKDDLQKISPEGLYNLLERLCPTVNLTDRTKWKAIEDEYARRGIPFPG